MPSGRSRSVSRSRMRDHPLSRHKRAISRSRSRRLSRDRSLSGRLPDLEAGPGQFLHGHQQGCCQKYCWVWVFVLIGLLALTGLLLFVFRYKLGFVKPKVDTNITVQPSTGGESGENPGLAKQARKYSNWINWRYVIYGTVFVVAGTTLWYKGRFIWNKILKALGLKSEGRANFDVVQNTCQELSGDLKAGEKQKECMAKVADCKKRFLYDQGDEYRRLSGEERNDYDTKLGNCAAEIKAMVDVGTRDLQARQKNRELANKIFNDDTHDLDFIGSRKSHIDKLCKATFADESGLGSYKGGDENSKKRFTNDMQQYMDSLKAMSNEKETSLPMRIYNWVNSTYLVQSVRTIGSGIYDFVTYPFKDILKKITGLKDSIFYGKKEFLDQLGSSGEWKSIESMSDPSEKAKRLHKLVDENRGTVVPGNFTPFSLWGKEYYFSTLYNKLKNENNDFMVNYRYKGHRSLPPNDPSREGKCRDLRGVAQKHEKSMWELLRYDKLLPFKWSDDNYRTNDCTAYIENDNLFNIAANYVDELKPVIERRVESLSGVAKQRQDVQMLNSQINHLEHCRDKFEDLIGS